MATPAFIPDPPAASSAPPPAFIPDPPAAQATPDENSGDLPLTSYGAATRAGFNSVANGTIDAIKGAASFLNPRPQNDGEKVALQSVGGYPGMLAHRLVSSLADLGVSLHPHEIAAAMHDIDQSADPMGTYLKILQKTAATGAGEALTAIGTEGAARGASEVKGPATAAARTATNAVGDTARGIVKGRAVEQAPAAAAVKAATGVEEVGPQMLKQPIDAARAAKNTLYQKIGEARAAAKPQLARVEAIDRELEGLDETLQPERAGNLENERSGIMQQLGDTGGADPKAVQQANAAHQHYKALQAVEKKMLNPRTIKGNLEHSAEPTINVDQAITQGELLKTTKWGNQLEQAFGKEGAKQLMDNLYAAQKIGAHAMKAQQVAKWVGRVALPTAVGATAAGVYEALK